MRKANKLIVSFFIVFLLLLSHSVSAANLHGYWSLDETSGTIAYDTGDIQLYDAACQGGQSFTNDSVAGHFGTAIDFDGIDDGIQIPALNLNSNTVTITAWVKRNGTQVYWPGIVNARTTNTMGGIQIDGETNNNLRYIWNDGGAETWGWNSGLVLPDNVWTFIALVIEPAKATIYMDDGGGMTSATNNVTHVAEEFDDVTYIGQDGPTLRFFKGAIDDVRIYDYSLSPAEILDAAANTPGTPGATVTQPKFRGVYQRNDVSNDALVPVSGIVRNLTFTAVNARYVVTAQPTQTGPWESMTINGNEFDGYLLIPAGGWYTIEVEVFDGATPVLQKSVEKVGVGEVFITSGQSNSTNCGDAPLTPANDTVSAWTGSVWVHADDPQPIVGGVADICSTDPQYGGSPWSRLSDLLEDDINVPIGFISTGYGGTAIYQWVPGSGTLYPRIQAAIADTATYGLRSILWHQGESDSLNGTSTASYANDLSAIIAQSRTDAGWAVPWGIAIVGYIPGATQPNIDKVRAGQMQVVNADSDVFEGPDTDTLGASYRYDGTHFNASGLYEHALMWQTAIRSSVILNPSVKITESGGSTDVDEFGPTSDTYTVVLTVVPTDTVTITVDPDVQTEVNSSGAGTPVQLTFLTSNWSTAQMVTVTAIDDVVEEGMHTSTITHVVVSNDTDYDGINVNNVIANVMDDDISTVDDIAENDIPVSGTVGGTYVNTTASDNTYESITEVETGGNPNNRYSYLEHKWPITVTGGDTVTFFVEAYHTSNSEGDAFVFAYSTTGASGAYTDMLTVTKTGDDNNAQWYLLPGGTSGAVHIRVKDTDQSAGNRTLDTIYIDDMYIRSESSSGPDTDPPTPNPATFASPPAAVSNTEITMTATTGSDASGPVEYFFDETSDNPGATDSGWVTDPVYNDADLDASTQYTYTVQMRDSILNAGTVSTPANATTDASGTLMQSVSDGIETITLRMTKESVRGPNFEVWVQNSSGTYDIHTPAAINTYIGTVDEYPDALAAGIVKSDGKLWARVYFDRGYTWITLDDTKTGEYGTNSPSFVMPTLPTVTEGQAGTTTYRWDVAIDMDYAYYSGYGGSDPATCLENTEFSLMQIKAIYLQEALLNPALGRVIIRSSQAQDPYDGITGVPLLAAMADEWNTNHTDADRDVGAMATPNIGGGVAIGGSIGTDSGYTINQVWADGDFDMVFRHEVGHNWAVADFHANCPEGYTINCGNDFARHSGPGVHNIFDERDLKIAYLDSQGTYSVVDVPPYAALDEATVFVGTTATINIDVLANDYDVNNDSISISSFESESTNGSVVTLSSGTGPGGRDELTYTAGNQPGLTDNFYYTIVDSSGSTASGIVVVRNSTAEPLRGYWKLDETSGTTASDESAANGDGTTTGFDFASSSVSGQFGTAADFDGVDDFIDLSSVYLNSNTVTISAWVKTSVVPDYWNGIVYDRYSGAHGLTFGDGADLRYSWNGAANTWGWESGLSVQNNTWTFVALVVEPTKATIYLNDGGTTQSATNTVTHLPAAFSNILIGSDGNNGIDRYLDGSVDDVRIYDIAMTPAQIEEIRLGGVGSESPSPTDNTTNISIDTILSWVGSAKGTTTRDVYFGTSTTPPLVSAGQSETTFDPGILLEDTTYYWRIDEIDGGTIVGDLWNFTTFTLNLDDSVAHYTLDTVDIVGSTAIDSSQAPNYDGAITSSPPNVTGQIGQALDFDGIDDYIEIPAMISDDFTISFWAKTSQTGGTGAWYLGDGLVDAEVAGVVNDFGTSLMGDKFAFGVYATTISSTSTINDDQWHHCVATRSVSNGEMKVYVDGGPPEDTATETTASLTAPPRITIARIQNANNYFDGLMDDVTIWDRVLTQVEIQILYDEGSGIQDTDPPTPNPATFASPPAAVSDTEITMTATTGSDATGPVEYLFEETTGGPGATDSGWVTNPVYNDADLSPSTQYTYTVQLRDSVTPTPNVGAVSAPANATTQSGCSATDMHVEAVVCSEVNCGGPNRNGRATVTIYDDCGNPVINALVDGTFTGAFGETINDIPTNSSGQAVFTTSGCERRPSFSFTVDAVTHGTLPHDSNDDLATGCSG